MNVLALGKSGKTGVLYQAIREPSLVYKSFEWEALVISSQKYHEILAKFMDMRKQNVLLTFLCLGTLLSSSCSGEERQKKISSGEGFSLKRIVDWGVYQIYWSESGYRLGLQQQLEQLSSKLPEGEEDKKNKRRPKYALFFRDLVRGFPKEVIEYNDSLGLTSIVSLELTIWGYGAQRNYLESIVQGELDDAFRFWARGAKAYGKPVIYRFGFEMNGNWFSWGEQPQKFQQAWKHVHALFQLEGATNVQWMFAPNVLWGSKTFEKDILPYYPGEKYVDMLGLDGYNFGDHFDQWHKWESYEKVFERSIQGMYQLAKKSKPVKPLLLSEIGCAEDKRKATWLQDFLNAVEQDSRISGFVYFNYDKRSEGEPNWRLDSDSSSLQVFQQWIKKEK